MKKMYLSLLFALVALPLCLSSPGFATTPEEQGLAIVQEMDRRDEGFADSTANMVMTLIQVSTP